MSMSALAHAYEPAMTPAQAMETLKKTDCAKSASECRYYATVEYVAYFAGCRAFVERNTGRRLTDEEWKGTSDFLDKWSIFKDVKLKKAVLKAKNPLKDSLIKETTASLMKLPVDGAVQQCERIALVQENFNPEEWSNILKKSANYSFKESVNASKL